MKTSLASSPGLPEVDPVPSGRGGFSYRLVALLLVASLLVLLPMLPACASAPPAGSKWVATWAQAMTSNYTPVKGVSHGRLTVTLDGYTMKAPPTLHGVTLRQTVRTSIGGNKVRIRLSNYFGTRPLTVTAAHVALQAKGSKDLSNIAASTDRAVTFDGKVSVTIAPGHAVTSDPVALHVPALSHLVVSLYFASHAALSSVHPLEPAATTVVAKGDKVSAATFPGPGSGSLGKGMHRHIYFLTGVDVIAPESTRVVVAYGDSITDGAYATALDKPWPEAMASIADSRPGKPGVAVVDTAISGDELTTDQMGRPAFGMSGLKRFERDVIDRPGVTDVVVLFGANDIDRGVGVSSLPTGVRAGDLEASLRMLADVAHEHHLHIYVATITPFAGFTGGGWFTPQHEAVREQVNHWIRHQHVFDGVVPFAKAVRGQYKPSPVAARQHPLPPGMATVCSGDTGLHPNDRGYAVMGTVAYNVLFDAHVVPAATCH